MEITLARLSSLLPHERVDKDRVMVLARSIAGLGYLLKPVIVERSTHVIIDGHHRAEALRLLGARLIPVVEASYGREITALKPVERMVPLHAGLGEAAGIIEDGAGGRAEALIIGEGGRAWIKVDLEEAYRLPQPRLRRGARLILPPLEPRRILGAAMRAEPYPPKSTNHVTALKEIHAPVKVSRLL